MNKKIIIIMLGYIFTASAMASSYEGTVKEIVMSTGESPARIGILVGPHNSECSGYNGDFFSYENADTGIGKIWTSALLTASATQGTVIIYGTGTCDIWGIEKVSHINIR